MKKFKLDLKWRYVGGALLLTGLFIFALRHHIGEKPLHITVDSGFYQEDINVEAISYVKNPQIYYTTDGTDPSEQGDTVLSYTEPIKLMADEDMKVYTLRFCEIIDSRFTISETRTYVVGKQVDERFSEDVIMVSIVTDPDNLYGYENGIFIEGKIYDDYLKEHPEDTDISSSTPTNFNQRGAESERIVNVEMFTGDGMNIISQSCGIRTGGQFSRLSEQKPFRLFARKEYGEETFSFPFFIDSYDSSQEGTTQANFGTLFFRNSGDDRQEAYIRDAVGQTLAREAGFPETEYVRPASVYINGEYAGFYWLQSQYTSGYFKHKYGKYSGKMVTLGSADKTKDVDTENELENQYGQEYMDLYKKYSGMDLTDDKAYEELNTVIDTQNYLQYMAIQTYMCNQDWPHNNNKCYRFVSSAGVYTKDTVFDGRYRYLLYDTDATMGNGTVRDSADPERSAKKLEQLLTNEDAPLFKALMKRKDCQEYYYDYTCYLIREIYTPENVARVVDELDAVRRDEINIYIEEITGYLPEEYKYLDMQLDSIKAWAEDTGTYMMAKMKELWGM